MIPGPMLVVRTGMVTFGLVLDPDTYRVIEAPPVARKSVGRSAGSAARYWRARGASVTWLP